MLCAPDKFLNKHPFQARKLTILEQSQTLPIRIWAVTNNRVYLLFWQIRRVENVVFHSFAYTCCTVFFQPFCGMSAIRFNVLNDRAFPHGCYRTLAEYKVVFFLEFLRFAVEFLRSDYFGNLIHWKKCSETELIAWKSVYIP